MVSMTDLGLPGLGTYTARVAFYRDSYAGIWGGAGNTEEICSAASFGQIELERTRIVAGAGHRVEESQCHANGFSSVPTSERTAK